MEKGLYVRTCKRYMRRESHEHFLVGGLGVPRGGIACRLLGQGGQSEAANEGEWEGIEVGWYDGDQEERCVMVMRLERKERSANRTEEKGLIGRERVRLYKDRGYVM